MKFVDLSKIHTKNTHETLVPHLDNNTSSEDTIQEFEEDVETVSDEVERMTASLLKNVGMNGVECEYCRLSQNSIHFNYIILFIVLVVGIATFIVSVLLIYGVKFVSKVYLNLFTC